jgi:adenylylsulfate kinase
MGTEQKGYTLWFTGLPCAGKTTLADAVAVKLRERGQKVERLDGDIVRKALTKDLGFSHEDRDTNIDRVTFVARLLSRNGVAVLSSFVSPYRAKRRECRNVVEEDSVFVEVFVNCPVQVCEERDVKGMYAKAHAGEIHEFTGVDDPYEDPENPEIVVHTDGETVEESTANVLAGLGKLGLA